ncbi:ATP-dependent DNA helicase RecQ [Collinsella tanakaei]|uniref:helicase-related protein n=1 Tax=Collinsella tanakaei TaxID=626935 RepID=UPI00195EF046|nr:helicase-related protein [Collinsella tanakaei]MBM6778739.1 ATP-dependent DNA helicase RecQ [Collinsella tanakaei]
MTNPRPFDIWLLDRIRSIVRKYEEEDAAIFFLGLSAPQAKLLAGCDQTVETVRELLDDEGHLDYRALSSTRKRTFRSLNLTDGPQLLLYEQLGGIRGSLAELYDGKVVIVRNNLFLDSEGYPCPGGRQDMEELMSHLDGGQGEEPPSAQCYGQVSEVGGHYLVSPIRFEDEIPCESIDLIEGVDDIYGGEALTDPVSVPGPQYLAARLAVSHRTIESMSFDLGDASMGELGPDGETLLALAGVLLDCGADCSIVSPSTREQDPHGGERLLPLLERYWGDGASFRMLSLYKNPDKNNEMTEVSQGLISEYVVKQAELAIQGSENFTNVLVTAPTGAGKSLLFQLAALYLAETYGVATLVIEPLKALMDDQVSGLRAKGVKSVAAINSDISFDERRHELDRVRRGEVSIIYLSPELLLSSNIDDILGGRKLGLVVIDEVHTVTSWGRDFRPDYWYLGPYLSKLRRHGMLFPVFCLTATAVYGGRDDMVNRTIGDLELGSCKPFLGNPRRENISFSIQIRNKANFRGLTDEVKCELAVNWINDAVANGDKAIVYCPYKSHVDRIMDAVGKEDGRVLGFHGDKDREYRNLVTSAFRKGSCRVLVATKAFGMGVDIGDITKIYHFAPTGNLADYVQEIGRAARDKKLRGIAAIDFFKNDSSYARRLYAMSRFAQWQLREIMGKLYSIYASKPRGNRSLNILVSPDSFSYLFAHEREEVKPNKIKAALMMIAQDLKETYNFPVMVVRPKPTYTTAYVCINSETESWFLSRYGKYVRKLDDAHVRYETVPNQNAVRIQDLGSIYLLHADKMWEEEFSDRTFGMFKHDLFSGNISPMEGVPTLSPRLVLKVTYTEDFTTVEKRFAAYLTAIRDALLSLARDGEFSKRDFSRAFEERLDASTPKIRSAEALLDLFVKPSGTTQSNRKGILKFVFRKTSPSGSSATARHSYQVNAKHASVFYNEAMRALHLLNPGESKACTRYLDPNALGARYDLAELLQALDLATYEARGGENPEIFIRLNDPNKLKALSDNPRYSNAVLKEQNERHDYAERVITGFFMTTMGTEERWDLIEEYFLGNDDYVAGRLGLSNIAQVQVEHEAQRKVKYRGRDEIRTRLRTLLKTEGTDFAPQPYFRIWRGLEREADTLEERRDFESLRGATRGSYYELPTLKPEIAIESTGEILHPLLAWKERKVLLFKQRSAAEYDLAKQTDWKPYLLGQGDSIAGLAEDIATRPHGGSRGDR